MADENRSVLPHYIARVLNARLRGAPGLPPGGSLWKKIQGVIRLVGEPGVVQLADLTAEQLVFTEFLRNAADGTSDGLGGIFLPSVVGSAGGGYSLTSSEDDLDLGVGVVHRIAPTAAGLSITGIVPPVGSSGTGGSTGCVKVLLSDGDYAWTLPHNDLGSAGENRILTPFGLPLVVPRGTWGLYPVGVLLYYTGEPSPYPMRWHAYPLGFSPDVIQGTENGALWKAGQASELVTIAAASSTDTAANLLPADSIIEAVVGRVTVAIPTATTFGVGTDPVGGDATRFASGVSVALNTTFDQRRQWRGSVTSDASGPHQDTATKIRITPSATPANANGRVRVTVFFRTFSPPGS